MWCINDEQKEGYIFESYKVIPSFFSLFLFYPLVHKIDKPQQQQKA